MLLGSWDANLTAPVSAHQSIGIAAAALSERKTKEETSAARARREISAFALTEWNALVRSREYEFAR
jgi:hypothetical protein